MFKFLKKYLMLAKAKRNEKKVRKWVDSVLLRQLEEVKSGQKNYSNVYVFVSINDPLSSTYKEELKNRGFAIKPRFDPYDEYEESRLLGYDIFIEGTR